ncbi:methyltransferase domain-containing protein [Patescibacteria group bacterium]|nr:methyltransferase domain-containing protein [Patescibacteria group bacterium]
MKKEIENFEFWNEEMAKKYNPDAYHNSRNIIVRWVENKRAATVIRFLDAREGEDILEVGCGAGNILEKIKKGNLVGVDISEFMLGLAKKKLLGQGAKLYKDDAEDLSSEVKDMKFDKIFCSEVLEHVRDPKKVLFQIARLCKPSAKVVISVPNERLINKLKGLFQKLRIFDIFFRGISKKMDDEWHLHVFDMRMLSEIGANYFSESKKAGIPFDWLPLHYVILFFKK